MSWHDVVDGLGPLRSSETESRRFGISISRLNVGAGWSDQFGSSVDLYERIRGQLDQAAETLVILRAPSALVRMGTDAIPRSRHVIPAGNLLYWGVDVAKYTPLRTPEGYEVRVIDSHAASSSDLDIVSNTIANSFDGYVSHYSHNPALAEELVTAGYQEWAASSLLSSAAAACVLLTHGETVLGVATVRDDLRYSISEIELAGMSGDHQGRGLYRHIMDAIVGRATANGLNSVVISTQSHNIRVQRAWATAGFRPLASIDTLHCMVPTR